MKDVLEPAVAPLTRPVLRTAEPVLSALRPVTEPVLSVLEPVTDPVRRAAAPVTDPLARAVGADRMRAVVGDPAGLRPREDITAAAVVQTPDRAVPVADHGQPQVADGASVGILHVDGHQAAQAVSTGDPMRGSGNGGTPAGPSGLAGSTSASPGDAHGGELVVTPTGARGIGPDRAWRAPPGGRTSLYWLVFYGNDHPS
ncbi:hypothetical protein [Amycolatopsis plumensis]|uniref:hypothetical protein n=1 Tax=Amycolatopsis plumensis TaxID=236508 RepID=UPI003608606B